MASDRSIAISNPSENGKRRAESAVPAASAAVPWVFIVNHHEPAREALRQLCTSVGLAVETYATAEAFLAALGGRRPGCLLLELCLPGMGGFGLQRELAARNLGLPVIVVTLDGNSMQRQRLHAWFVVLWILASTASVLSGMLDDLVSDLPELLAGVVSSLGMA